MGVQARFYISSVKKTAYNQDQVEVELRAATRADGDNESWSKYTPSGEMSMVILNPAAAVFFEENLGRDVRLTMELDGPDRFAGEHSTKPIPDAAA